MTPECAAPLSSVALHQSLDRERTDAAPVCADNGKAGCARLDHARQRLAELASASIGGAAGAALRMLHDVADAR